MNKTNPPISDKPSARKRARKNITVLEHEEKIKASETICRELKDVIAKTKPQTLILYNPLPDEVDISSLHSWFKSRGNIITISHDGLFEPFEDSENTLAIIPGRAFTQNGKRIGR